MKCFLSIPAQEFKANLAEEGGKPFHYDSILRWIFQRGVWEFDKMSDLPAALREKLKQSISPLSSRIAETRQANDGTAKLLLELADGEKIETVVMPSQQGHTICVSTQVGCPVACSFCASGAAGLMRNLEWWEIVEQFLHGRRIHPFQRAVVMGIGEPTLNLENLISALDVISDPKLFGLSARKITISTVGYPERIAKLAESGKPYQLAVSLHAPNDTLRRELIPTMTKVTIPEIIKAAYDYFETTGREVTFEYVLLRGVNDLPEHARELATRLHGSRCTVNLIPYNPVPQFSYRRPSSQDVSQFQDILRRARIPTTVRWSKGLGADAACGQLRISSHVVK